MRKIKTISIPLALGIICSVIVLVLIIRGELKEVVFSVVIWPVQLMLIYSFIVFVFSLVTVPFYWLTLPFRKYFIKKGKLTEQSDAKIKPFFVLLTLLIALYVNYRLFFPADDTFWADFKKVTNRAPPPSAKIITKHSDYFSECMSAIIEMSPKHYMTLLYEIQNDSRFESNTYIGVYNRDVGRVLNPFSKIMEGSYNVENITHAFLHTSDSVETRAHVYHIGFFANQKWVVYNYCFLNS